MSPAKLKTKPPSPTPTRTPLDERDRLREEMSYAAHAEAEVRGLIAETEAAIDAVQAERIALYKAKARKQGLRPGQEGVDNIESELKDLRSLLDSQQVEQSAARMALVAATAEREALYREHLDAFAAEAEEATQAAMAALAAVAEPLADAHQAWNHATAAWSPLLEALKERVARDEDERGIWRDRSTVTRLAQVPRLTLPLADFPLRHPAARPAFLQSDTPGEVAGDGTFHVVDAGAPLPEIAE